MGGGKWEAPLGKLPQDKIKRAKKFGDTKKSKKRTRAAVGSRADSVLSTEFCISFLSGS